MRSRKPWMWIGTLVVCLAALAGSASATTLADVMPGDVFLSGNGKLQFTDFEFVSLCGTCVTPDEITLNILADGVQLLGPITSSGHEFKGFQVTYAALAVDPSMPITGSSLELDSVVDGGFAAVYGLKRITGKTGGRFPHTTELAQLSTFDISRRVACPRGVPAPCFRRTSDLFDSSAFGSDQQEIRVKDTVKIFAAGGDATWKFSANHFGSGSIPVPEPSTAAILAAGLLGLGLAGGRRRR